MDALLKRAADLLSSRGASYGDARWVDLRREDIAMKNGAPDHIGRSREAGIGIRVLVNGRWGFAATGDLSPDGVDLCARRALAVAAASAITSGNPIELAPVKPVVDSYETPYRENPLEVAIETKLTTLAACCHEMQRSPKVKVAQAYFTGIVMQKRFCSTEGADIAQTIVETGGGISARAIEGGESQVRSFPSSFRGNFATAGYEFFRQLGLEKRSERIGAEAEALLSAPVCPAGRRDIVIEASQLALQVHESIGHPIELDRVLGSEAAFAGSSFLTPADAGRLRYGSKHVNVVADATAPGGLGTFGYDDEGAPARCQPIITGGLFEGFLSSRETAHTIGAGVTGAMRAASFDGIPLVRMTNINLLAGEWALDDLLADTDGGLFLSTNRSWSIDDKRLNFQFGTEAAWAIQGGKLGRMYKNPSYTGITPEFWNACDAVCNKDHWELWGTPNCGKGQPMQTAHVGHGTAPARFRNVQVGIVK